MDRVRVPATESNSAIVQVTASVNGFIGMTIGQYERNKAHVDSFRWRLGMLNNVGFLRKVVITSPRCKWFEHGDCGLTSG